MIVPMSLSQLCIAVLVVASAMLSWSCDDDSAANNQLIADHETSSDGEADSGIAVATCMNELQALLEALGAAAGPCDSNSDCSYFTAWAAPDSAQICNGDWPVAALEQQRSSLERKNQALADCQASTGTLPSVGTCSRANPAAVCAMGVCKIPNE